VGYLGKDLIPMDRANVENPDLDSYRTKVFAMGEEELLSEKSRLGDNLDDIITERYMTQQQTGIHVSSMRMRSLMERFDRDEDNLNQRLVVVREALASLNSYD
jgi:hypothetical protein